MNKNNPEIYQEVFSKILAFLSHKPRSENELGSKLDYYLKSHSLATEEKAEIKKEILEHLSNLNLSDDISFASMYVAEKIRSTKGISKNKVKTFLIKKGISREAQNVALELFTDEVEAQKALLDATKKMSTLKKQPRTAIKSKLYAFLKSRGYSSHIISTVVDTIVDVK